jgi:hypothetical protein
MKLITRDQAMHAITHGEFGYDLIRSADKVVIILTQSWCLQWHAMRRFVSEFSAAMVYCLEYDRTDFVDEFRVFKERVLGNDQIPYVRYYSVGVLVAESNAVSEEAFALNLGK